MKFKPLRKDFVGLNVAPLFPLSRLLEPVIGRKIDCMKTTAIGEKANGGFR